MKIEDHTLTFIRDEDSGFEVSTGMINNKTQRIDIGFKGQFQFQISLTEGQSDVLMEALRRAEFKKE